MPFSFSQTVFFKREMANPINQNLEFVARLVVASMHTPFLFVHHAHVVYGGAYNIYTYRDSQMTYRLAMMKLGMGQSVGTFVHAQQRHLQRSVCNGTSLVV